MIQRIKHWIKFYLILLREDFYEWLEWQDAKAWAKEYHPGWVEIAKRAKRSIIRQTYRNKILRAYRGEDNE